MKLEVRVPTLSDSVASGTLLPWRKQVGETVARDETLVDLETDKVILEIPAPASGTLVELRREEGAVVKADEVVAVIETGEGAAAGTPAVKPGLEKMPVEARTTPSPFPQGIPSLRDIRGEGEKAAPNSYASAGAAIPPPPQPSPLKGEGAKVMPAPMAAPPSPQPSPRTGEGANVGLRPPTAIKREPMSRLRQRVAERLVAAQHTAAMLTTFNEVNMQPVNELRQRFKAEFEVKHGVKLGYMSFFVRAVCQAMRQFPVVNAAIDGSDIVWHDDVDIGIAISSPRGLVVPILRRAQTLSSAGIEAAIVEFARRARDSKLTLEDLSGGSFSITNGGVFGSLLSTPILNPPQSAILGMHTIQERPVAENGQVVIRPMMYLALTYDHRLIDGRDAVQFLVAVKAALEAPESLLQEN
ncbi:MAG: 2-oxoglutarate dehydrogenase complex dihydrolipoyllysine-residue succinyltransferase [Gammaproteobacteria bacterium]|nr:2-oxoglutarate dehydrogenase complex dihydrolipoyllysine-residue succinyltransferase [Gammaproteobacteria bacterium]MBU1407111.1 2-oxoglutarate dehydrogenase complex dihydrolipoyllysine-residue succinyltransferase [Gammaproteobacteria bacterium]